MEKQPDGISLKYLLDGIAANTLVGDIPIQGICMDSRLACEGDLFIAYQGLRTSGQHFIKDAAGAGAVAALVDAALEIPAADQIPIVAVDNLRQNAGIITSRFYGDPSARVCTIGVTGTNGKTSVAYYLADILAGLENRRAGLIGTLGYGYPHMLKTGLHTTPDQVTLQRQLAEFVREGANPVIMEVSSQGLDQGRVAGVAFEIGVFTNLSQDHLDYHGNMAAYSEAKKQLFLTGGLRHAIINIDDGYGRKLCNELEGKLNLVRYGLVADFTGLDGSSAHVMAMILESSLASQQLAIHSTWGSGQVRIRHPGRFNAYNLLACLATLCLIGIPFNLALDRLAGVSGVPGRLERFGGNNRALVVIDYAHTPDALENILALLREHTAGKLICVFGCGGERDRNKRPIMGAAAARYADHIILTNDNPRHEDPEKIIADILQGIDRKEYVSIQPDRMCAITNAITEAEANDVVLIAGKGHETSQDIAGRRIPFSDRLLVRNLLGDTA